ncbi:extracellular solute-binding protein [Bosea sp. BK604]|uniref:ABC transporter substrate-binding protein n=1 Tax=Bosea sp. BK604 TaxID=2512180 RepID=UPI0010499E54|nr:extracellular solute-binding protein [Bosea sp. BK604]TCR61814.1 spermidine/putrescine-binding protein [Bosea sp. BK604]
MDRRQFLSGSAGLVAANSLSGPIGSALAQPKASQIVVMTWGGQWGDALKASSDVIFEQETGVKVVQDRGSTPDQRITKVKLSVNNQQYDIIQLVDLMAQLGLEQGALQPLNLDSPRLPNLRKVPKRFFTGSWVALNYSPLGIVYNTKLKNPPKSFADLWKPEFKGRIALPEISHSIGSYIIPIGAMAAGKSPSDEKAGFEMLKKMVDQQPMFIKDTDSIMNSLRNEDALVGLLYKAQTYTLQGWGGTVDWVWPSEGAIAYASGAGIAKGTKNLELAETYLNTLLDPRFQKVIAERFNYAGSNPDTEAVLTPELQKRVHMSEDDFKRLVELDPVMMMTKRAEWTDRWNRAVSGG